MFYESSICLEQYFIGKRPKDFEFGGFPSCISRNTYFFWKRPRKSKKFQDVRKSRDISKQKAPFYDDGYVYQVLKLKPMLSTNKVVYVCQVSKLQHIYAMGLTLKSVPKTAKHTRLYQI